MATQILMPALSPSMEEGRLARWLVREGDDVAAGDVLAEIETDKATMDFEASADGRIGALLIDEGTENVAVDTPIAHFVPADKGDAQPAPFLVHNDAGSSAGPNARPGAIESPRVVPNSVDQAPEAPAPDTRARTMREALRDALAEEMRRDGDVFLLGEEIGEFQGAYKISQGLLDEFGPRRVVDTPVTEAGFAGLGIGAAYSGLRPVVEFMTFNFALQAMDQIINSAAKVRAMSGGALTCPIVFRGPNGASARVGAQHSQDFAAMFAQIPGLKVAMPYCASDAKGLLKAAIRDPDPVIFLENETLYGASAQVPTDADHIVPLGKARIWRSGVDLTLVSYGAAMARTLEAGEALAKDGISAEVIDLRCLRPLDSATVAASLQKTHRCVIVEDSFPVASVGRHLASALMEQAFDWLDAPVRVLSGIDAPMPYAAALERIALPSTQAIVAAAREVWYR